MEPSFESILDYLIVAIMRNGMSGQLLYRAEKKSIEVVAKCISPCESSCVDASVTIMATVWMIHAFSETEFQTSAAPCQSSSSLSSLDNQPEKQAGQVDCPARFAVGVSKTAPTRKKAGRSKN
ncbi:MULTISPECIES: hypothetical protein [Burkholderia]|uniref:hypothetical protein n=1 Tax=Burkholderia TaxID=32008 RepID=UPI001588569F|nr:hypothetical protein [Burkholderia cepacia]MCA8053890.1 hypothetical protein [Burkholderia cepacia]MCA8131805.1 hypothetical protein [Burkholderia cepacia]MCA8165264.1 hypothetical protein [Burkholderia cepacia]MDN7638167.1 hypothetical protein [Burkholderia cepacia]HEM7893946.1 hypothetical protein [Burkholderia cepacia]